MQHDYSEHRILIADDQVASANALAGMLQAHLGCGVDVVPDGDAALAHLHAEAFDVIVTDMMMPGCSGFELVHTVKRDFPDTDIIVMTAFPAEFPYVDIIEAGASDFISKPNQPMELEAKLLRLLQERRLRREVEREKMRILEYVRDVEAAHEAKEAAENKYRSLFEHSLNGMALLADDGLFVEDGNQAFWTMLGNDGELDGGARLSLLGLIPDEASRQRLLHGVALVRSNGRGTLADLPLQLHGNGVGRFDLGLSEVRIGGQSQLLASFKDVTHQQALSAQLAEMAHTDALTGLLNKRSFAPRLEEALFDADEERRPVTLLALDLDNFKQVNDRFGHQRGDDLLRMTGEVILGSIRNGSDSAFRCGGDEFFVLLAGSHGEAGRVVADRIRGAFSRRDTAGTTLSIGLAEWHAGMSAGEFMGEADRALYAAKAAGKDSVSLA